MTARPTTQPSMTLVPTSTPSLIGLVAFFDITKVITSTLTDSEINDIQAEVMQSFEVIEDQVDTTGNITSFFMNFSNC